MNIRKLASIYSIIMGISMIGMWAMFYLTGGIPELVTKPSEIALHLTAEFTTAFMLIIGGIGILKHKRWGRGIYYFSMGMLMYTLIVSPGYYLQQGVLGFVIMFAAFAILAVLFFILMMKDKEKNA